MTALLAFGCILPTKYKYDREMINIIYSSQNFLEQGQFNAIWHAYTTQYSKFLLTFRANLYIYICHIVEVKIFQRTTLKLHICVIPIRPKTKKYQILLKILKSDKNSVKERINKEK